MLSAIDQPQSETINNEDLWTIEDRLEQLSVLLEPESSFALAFAPSDSLKLGNYRTDLAKVIDQAMSETAIWWVPSRVEGKSPLN